MARIAVGEVLVGLVGEVINPALPAERVERAQIGFAEDGAARVVRRDGDDRPGSSGDRALDRVQPELIAVVGGDAHGAAARHLDRHLVIEVERDRQDDLVAGAGGRHHRVHERHVAAGGDHDAAAARQVDAVLGGELGRHPFTQRGQAGHRLIFMRGRRAKAGTDRIDGGGGRPVVHHPLAE